MNPDDVLVVVGRFDDGAEFVPSSWIASCLVLDPAGVTDEKLVQRLQGVLSVLPEVFPFRLD